MKTSTFTAHNLLWVFSMYRFQLALTHSGLFASYNSIIIFADLIKYSLKILQKPESFTGFCNVW